MAFWAPLLAEGPVLVLRWTVDRRIISAEGNAQRLANIGLEPGSDYLQRLFPDDAERVCRLFDSHKSEPLDTEYRLLGADDLIHRVREYSLPAPQASDTRLGLLILQGPSRDLAAAHTALRQCEQEFQDFAYIASHDLQEPLRKVRAFGSRLEQKFSTELGETGQDYLTRMLNATGRLQGFLDGLLEYSRVMTRGTPPARCDLNLICAEQVARLRKRAEPLDALIAVGDLPVIQADAAQIGQLLRHLLDNALKFHMQGIRPVIAVAADTSMDRTEITVTDNGMGFPQTDAHRIFQVFQRLHGHGRYAGAGAGLAICRRIAERHGGSIRAQSTPGAGTRVIVSLPFRSNESLP